jgi:hypothetical protein
MWSLVMDLKKFSAKFTDSFEFFKSVYQEASSLTSDERLELQRPAKQLLEEILPIALLSQHLRTLDLQIDVLWCGDSQEYDGKLKLEGKPVNRGLYERQYFVEVTTATSPIRYLQREALLKNRFVNGGDDIHRLGQRGSPIVSNGQVQNVEAPSRQVIEWIVKCLESKADKTYPTPCILVINVDALEYLSVLDWADVFRAINPKAIESNFTAIFAIDTYHNSVISLSGYKL